MRSTRIPALLTSLILVAGCSSRTAGLPPVAEGGFAPSGATIAAHVTPGDGTNRIDAVVDLPPAAAGAKQVAVVGSLYPSYVSSTVGNNTQIITPKGKILSAIMTFSGMPKANNEWAVVAFYKYATDGSTVYIGSEATMVNVTKPIAKVHVDSQSTQVFQATMALLGAGLVTAEDLQKNPKLPATVQRDITTSHIKPDPTTGLFSPGVLAHFVQVQTPKWQRTVNVVAGSTARIVSVTNDVQLASEGFLSANTRNFLGTAVGNSTRPAGAPCGNQVPNHVPGTNPTPAPISCATIYGTSNGKITIPVYGNAVVIGASNGKIPYTGILKAIPYRAPGSKVTIKLPALKKSQIAITTSDPFDWAFGTSPAVVVSLSPLVTQAPFAVTGNFYPGWNFSKSFPVQYGVPLKFSKADPFVAVNGWNPFNLANDNFYFCTAWGTCEGLTNAGKFPLEIPFADPGTNLKYFKWASTNGTKIVAVKGCPGYTVTPKSAKIDAIISTKVPTVLTPSQQLTFHFNSKTGCGGVPAPGSIVTVTAESESGQNFVGQGSNTSINPRALVVQMSSFQPITKIKKVTIDIHQVSGVTIDLVTIASPYTP